MCLITTMLIPNMIWFLLVSIPTAAALKEHCETVENITLKCNFIPTNIPEGILTVLVLDYKGKNEKVQVNSSFFQSDNWSKVEQLEFTANISNDFAPLDLKGECFKGLQSLKKLRMLSNNVEMDPNAFVGLDSVKSLDMSGCVRLRLKTLISSLNGNDKLPALEELKIANINFFLSSSAAIDRTFTNALKTKNITHLDLSGSKISNLDIVALYEDFKHLKVLNVSLASITGDFLGSSTTSTDLENQTFVDVVDFSYIRTFWIYLYGKFAVYNQVFQSSELGEKISLFSPRVVNLSGWMGEHVEFWTYNITINITGHLPVRSEEVIVQQTNFRRLDATVYCKGFEGVSLQRLNVAQNGLEFLHPSILSCFPNLQRLDLSINQMFKMVEENSPLFEKLFLSLQHLKMVTLSNNNMKIIPDGLFHKNHELELLDLSNNKLSQITFTLNHLSKLQVLNLQHNKLKILNEISLSKLDSIPIPTNQNETTAIVTMKFNLLQCSKCEAKPFIHWLTKTRLLDIKEHTCVNENGAEQDIGHDTIQMVESICKRKIIIISTSVSTSLFIIIVSITLSLLYKLRRRKMLKANRSNARQLLQKGKDQYEFAVFLSYSSRDDDFVKMFVHDQLNDNLKTTTDIKRNLVCTGDAHLRLGLSVLNETINCIERSAVVIAVVSDNYCESRYCQSELDQAYSLNKPIILMLKEHVNEKHMMPTMKMLFKKNVRILWGLGIEKGEYVLKTTWENVCTSILDLITPEKEVQNADEETELKHETIEIHL